MTTLVELIERVEETPRRVQLSRRKGWRMPHNTVKVDRATGFGNPFPITKGTQTAAGKTSDVYSVGSWEGPALWFCDTKAEAAELSVKAFRAWLDHPARAQLRERVALELRGKNLACWCKPGEPCHADVLLELANRP
jgi:hypothetical protein